MERSTLHVLLLCTLLLGTLGLARPAQAQEQGIPDAVQRELQQRGMTAEEARALALQLGIDLSNPVQAAQRLRELGFPEARIQALLQAVQGGGGMGTFRGGAQTEQRRFLFPDDQPIAVAEEATVAPDSIFSAEQLPINLTVRVPLRSRQIITRVEPFLTSPVNDTLAVENVRRLRGSVVDGTWGGRLRLQPDATHGVYLLWVRASTPDTTLVLPTDRAITLLPPGQTIDRDSVRVDSLAYFGYDIFERIPDAFQPSPVGPVDNNYIIGPEDELRLAVWGGAEFQYDLQVDDEGRVFVPNVGQFSVSGRRLRELREEMKMWLSRSYAGLTSDPPSVFMDLTVTRRRPVQVYVLGEVEQPGGYVISSSSTVFNALYSVGGPLRRGTMRDIQVIRDGETIATVDLYNYLLRGYEANPVVLQNNDYVFIPPRGETVAITGAVKRPAYYEMEEDETFADLLEYAGGLEPNAYTKRFQISRIVSFDERTDPSVPREVLDIDLNEARRETTSVPIADGDRVHILSVMDVQNRAVKQRIEAAAVAGAVYQSGRYAINGRVRTVRDLIREADGLTGDAYRPRAELIRLNDDLEESIRSLNLNEVMEDEPTANIVLQPGDSLWIASVRDMQADYFVEIDGAVREPGSYEYRQDMTIQDLLYAGGGLADPEYLKDVFLERADLFRESPDGSGERVIPFHLGDALDGEGMADEVLRPGDVIRIYPARVERLEDQFVEISGAVKDTGRYEWRENLTLKDLILQANGFQEGASLQSVEVTRMVRTQNNDGLRARRINVPLVNEGNPEGVSFSVRDTARVLRQAEEFVLEHRDRVYVRTDPSFQPQETVAVRGEVQFPGEYTLLRDNETLSNVIARSGGILPTGYPKGGRLMREGEQVIVPMERALRGDADDDVILQPGDEVIIPPEPNTVTIRGNVANEGLVKHEPGQRVDYYLERAGGLRENTEAVFLTQASGATFRIKTGWFRRTPRVDDGAVIRVVEEPEREQRQEIDIRQTLTDSISILSSALTVIVLATRAF